MRAGVLDAAAGVIDVEVVSPTSSTHSRFGRGRAALSELHEDGHAAYPLLTSIFAAAAAQNSTRSRKARGAR